MTHLPYTRPELKKVDKFWFRVRSTGKWHVSNQVWASARTSVAVCGAEGQWDRIGYQDAETRPYSGNTCRNCETAL